MVVITCNYQVSNSVYTPSEIGGIESVDKATTNNIITDIFTDATTVRMEIKFFGIVRCSQLFLIPSMATLALHSGVSSKYSSSSLRQREGGR